MSSRARTPTHSGPVAEDHDPISLVSLFKHPWLSITAFVSEESRGYGTEAWTRDSAASLGVTGSSLEWAEIEGLDSSQPHGPPFSQLKKKTEGVMYELAGATVRRTVRVEIE